MCLGWANRQRKGSEDLWRTSCGSLTFSLGAGAHHTGIWSSLAVFPPESIYSCSKTSLWTELTVVKENYVSPTHQTHSLSWWRLHWFDTSGKLRQLLLPQVLWLSSVAWETSNRRPPNLCNACNATGFTFASYPSWWASSRLWRGFTGLVEAPYNSVEDRRGGWMCSASLGLWKSVITQKQQLGAPQSHVLPQLTMFLSLKFL